MNYSNGKKSYHTPSKLWRQIQKVIRTNNEQDFERLLCGGEDRAPSVARMLLSQRLANDVTMVSASNKHRILQLNISTLQTSQHHVQQLFGPSGRDLNALQMALFLQHETMARSILAFLQHYASPTDLLQFVNHPWGHENSSLHLASFLGMDKLVQQLLECGADTTHRNIRQYGPLDGCTKPACIQLLQQQQQPLYSPAASTTINITEQQQPTKESTILPMDLPRTSMLLKKAVQRSMTKKEDNNMITKDIKPPVSFSTSTSSTSSYSSFSSLDEPLSPSPSNQVTDYHGKQRYLIPSPPKSPSPQYDYHDYGTISSNNNNRRIRMMPYLQSHMNQPTLIPYRDLRSSPPPPPSVSYDQNDDEKGGNNTIIASETDPKSAFHSSTAQSVKSKTHSPSPAAAKSVRFSPELILFDACMRGDIEDLMDLIKQQQQQQSKQTSVLLQEWQDQHATPILSFALLYQQEPMAKCLLSLGADVNATDRDGWAPLHYAATLQLWPLVIVLAHHPDVHLGARTNNGLKVYDCPRTMTGQRRCKILIERAKKKRQQ